MNYDKVARYALLTFGLAAFAGGIALMIAPSMAPGVPLSLGFVTLVALLALALGVWIARTRWSGGVLSHTSMPNPEQPLATPAPGEELDEMVHNLLTYRKGTIEYRENIRERVAEAAVSVIKHREDCTEEEAVAMLENGEWTDNSVAASFFTGQNVTTSDSLLQNAIDLVSETESMEYDDVLAETVDAIAELAGVETPEREDDDQGGGFLSKLGSRSDGEEESAVFDTVRERTTLGKQVTETCSIYDEFSTNHWLGASAFALVAIGFGAFMFQPGLLLVGAVCAGYAAYSHLGGPPAVESLTISRQMSTHTPLPGEEVTVRVTVTNEGNGFLPDLRLVDRVPPTMQVVDGSPRVYTSLRAGDSVTFEYTTVAERGEHKWPMFAVARSISGGRETEAEITPDPDTDEGLRCVPPLQTVVDTPTRQQTSLYSGSVSTETPGEGLEFFAVRKYQHGDPMRRINWKQAAKTGELSTIEYRQEKAANVLLLFDARESAYVSPSPGLRHAVDLSVDAANEVFASLDDAGNLVGIGAFDTVPCWLSPSAGDEHREKARLLFANHPALASLPPELKDVEGQYIDPMTHIRRRLSPSTQIIMFSPLCDDYTETVARRLDSSGHRVTILSPDPTNTATVGQRLARVERQMRINHLQKQDIRVIDWDPSEQLHVEFERAKQKGMP